ncbi:MAG TPA: radical SAM family heme chaperone HemW [Microbacteriaceae bacterium]|nr:radical SAM family heme chaperone HemW [Microbacteriaceae bacterium]
MPGALPDGEPVPPGGALPDSVAIGAADRGWSAYVHVPFCTVRCGYCDFNTYTADELRGERREAFASRITAEIALAKARLCDAGVPDRRLDTVFLGGGTPTLLPTDDLGVILDELRGAWGLSDGAEVTVEANPDTVTAESIRRLADAGVTRLSIGMQSAVPHVLTTLDRTHTPSRVAEAVAGAKAAGLQVSVDLIYGTPGESLEDWRASVEAAIALEPDHISAYALIVEAGTKIARDIARGVIAAPDDDLAAAMYELADAAFAAAGYDWYELSNWSRSPETRSRHNLAYWLSQDWWGFGPGAHSHVGGLRWWNVKHPAAYAQRLTSGESPAAAREHVTETAARLEHMLLESRLATGASLDGIAPTTVAELIGDGLIDGREALRGRAVLTLQGRLLADRVAQRLTD